MSEAQIELIGNLTNDIVEHGQSAQAIIEFAYQSGYRDGFGHALDVVYDV